MGNKQYFNLLYLTLLRNILSVSVVFGLQVTNNFSFVLLKNVKKHTYWKSKNDFHLTFVFFCNFKTRLLRDLFYNYIFP